MADVGSTGKIGTLALDAAMLEGLAAGIGAFAARCRSRVYPEEGIPAMLVVEDLRGDPGRAAAPRAGTEQDLLLAAAIDLYGRLARDRGEAPGATDLATALEMLAARCFLATPLPDLPTAPCPGPR